MTQEKIVDRIVKLKAMAESADAIGNEQEAEAFASMYQRLMLQYKIEMSDLDVSQQEADEPVTKHHIDYTKYPDIRKRKARIAWIERLASIVARAHFCRILVYTGSSSRVSLVGRKSDAQVAEFVFITLQRSIESLAVQAEQKYRWQVYKRDGNCKAAQGYKGAFTQAFVQRLSERYEELRNEVVGGQTMALVRVNKAEDALNDFFKAGEFKTSSALRRIADFHGVGAADGRRAADAVNLKGKAVTGSATTALLK